MYFRCRVVGVVTAFLLFAQAVSAMAAQSFNLQHVQELARDLAARPFEDNRGTIPENLAQLSYDQWRDIRFSPEKSLWRSAKLPFEVQFFHPGLFYDRTVSINIVENGKPEALPFDPSAFDYGRNALAGKLPTDMNYAGFRVHTNINSKKYKDEFLVFLGASYFRAVGKGHQYGLSARGLAVDTAGPSGEEFPFFKEFWIVQPQRKDKNIVIYALMDSKRVTGAFRFTATPGQETVLNVESVFFLRAPVAKIGIAPLTSMYIFGENSPAADDFRPEVHDSDGLLAHLENDEWIWRPLRNPRELTINSFTAPNIRGMGLMQRDTNYDHYMDLEAHYQDRPSVWIEPVGDWGMGQLELVQIPSPEEIHDNIVSYWVPAEPLVPGTPYSFAYDMHWCWPDDTKEPYAHVTYTRHGKGRTVDSRLFVLEYAGGPLDKLPETAALDANVWIGNGGKLIEKRVYRNKLNGAWRLTFEVAPDSTSPLSMVLPDKRPLTEMRATLMHGITPITETWSYATKL